MIFLDLASIIAFLLVILKGSDFILLKHQEQALQEKIETLTLWVDDLKPIDYVIKLMSKKNFLPKLTFAISITILLSFVIYNRIYITEPIIPASTLNSEYSSLLIISIGLAYIFHKNIKRIRYSDLISHKNISNEIIDPIEKWNDIKLMASFLVVFNFIFCLFLYTSYSFYIHKEMLYDLAIILMVAIAAFSGLYRLAVVSTIIAILVCIYIIQELIKFLLFLYKGFLWRISEYKNGAFSALILLFTISLGVLNLYLKLS